MLNGAFNEVGSSHSKLMILWQSEHSKAIRDVEVELVSEFRMCLAVLFDELIESVLGFMSVG